MRVKFTVPGEPKAKGRPRFMKMGKGVKTYTPHDTAVYENLVKLSYIEQTKGAKLIGPVRALMYAVFPIPKSASKKKQQEMRDGVIKHTKKPDADNIAKSILDSLNGIAFDDDSQVFELYVHKAYGDNPHVRVILDDMSENRKE